MTTTLMDLAERIAEKEDLLKSAAADLLKIEISQIKDLDGREIDTDEISDEDAESVLHSWHYDERWADELLIPVEEATARLEKAKAAEAADGTDSWDTEILTRDRDGAIIKALREGARIGDVAQTAGLIREEMDDLIYDNHL